MRHHNALLALVRAIPVALLLAVGVTACGASDPFADFVKEARATGGTEGMTDGQVVLSGRSVCDLSQLAPGDAAGKFGEAPEPFVKVALKHCDDLRKPLTPEQAKRYQLDTPASPGAAAPAAPSTPSAAPTPAKVARGQRFDVVDDNGTVMGSAAITDIQVDPTCTTRYGSATPPEKGHFIAIRMDVATSSTYNDNAFSYPSGYDFGVTGPDGYTTGAVYSGGSCIADREQFAPMQPSSKYRGWVLIDSPAAAGSLTFRPHFAQVWPGVTVDLP